MGKLVVIEGLDGCGKTIQTTKLSERLLADKYNLRLIDFPQYDSDSSFFVKKYLDGTYGTDPNNVSAQQAALCYAMDRFHLFKSALGEFRDFLNEENSILLANRYTTSNMLFQAAKITDKNEVKKFLVWLENLEYNILEIPRPDLTFLLYMPIEHSIRLMKGRDIELQAKKNNMSNDIHENNEHFLKMVADRAPFIAEHQNFEVINCIEGNELRTAEDINNEIYAKVKRLF